jgi:hypothetical protein
MDEKGIAPTRNVLIATERGTTSPNAGPRAATKKDNARLAGLIITITVIIAGVTACAEPATETRTTETTT